VELANRTIYGLAAALWTADVKRAHRVAARIEAGPSGSTPTTRWTPPRRSAATSSPGTAGSWAARLELYTQVKSVWVDLH
jgi:acyl-CoA reductase-like NAD-dependent aldehyde dehydrogenase